MNSVEYFVVIEVLEELAVEAIAAEEARPESLLRLDDFPVDFDWDAAGFLILAFLRLDHADVFDADDLVFDLRQCQCRCHITISCWVSCGYHHRIILCQGPDHSSNPLGENLGWNSLPL